MTEEDIRNATNVGILIFSDILAKEFMGKKMDWILEFSSMCIGSLLVSIASVAFKKEYLQAKEEYIDHVTNIAKELLRNVGNRMKEDNKESSSH